MYISKARAGNVAGHSWPHDGAILEVEDTLAEELIQIPNGGFTIAAGPGNKQPEPTEEPETPEAFDEVFEQGEPVEASETPEPKRTAGRPRLPRDEHGNIIRN